MRLSPQPPSRGPGRSLARTFALTLALGSLAACGGGSGAGEAPAGEVPAAAGTGSLQGGLTLAVNTRPAVTELEPNDTLGAPQALGGFLAGQRVTIFGAADAASDPLDGYRLRCAQRLRVEAVLTVEEGGAGGAAPDLDVLVYDATSLQPVLVLAEAPSGATFSFLARGALDVVVAAVSGAAPYRLELTFSAVPHLLTEQEPNDAPGEATYVGALYPGETFEALGTADAVGDPHDGWLLPLPLATTLALTLEIPAFLRLDLEVLDATADLGAPVPLLTLTGADGVERHGSLTVAAGRLLLLRVHAATGFQPFWRLRLSAQAPAAGAPKPGGATPAAAPARLAVEGARLPRLTQAYGRVPQPLAEGEVLVQALAGAEADEDEAVALAGGEELLRIPAGPRRVRVALPAGLDPVERARATLASALRLAGAPGVAWAEPNARARTTSTPDDTHYPLQWHYGRIHLPEAWSLTHGSDSVIVAVIDTGITPHPDLAARLVPGYDFISDPQIALDGDGLDPDPTDVGDRGLDGVHGSYHGTHVAGTIGATTDNGAGVAGVTWATRIMPLRALGLGGGTWFDIANAIRFAAGLSNSSGTLPAAPARVINMSLGGPVGSQVMLDAVTAARAAGVVLVASAGNEGHGTLSLPAGYAGVISVAASDALDARAPYSSYGPGLDVTAPGGDLRVDRTGDGYADGVLSTIWDDSTTPGRAAYGWYQGTSMAAPHVAGVVALMLAVSPTLDPATVEQLLTSTCRDLDLPGPDVFSGYGLVDAYRAVASAAGVTLTPPTLRVDTLRVDLGASESLRDLVLTNLGTLPLTVDAPFTTTADGGAWLQSLLIPSPSGLSNASGLRLLASRAGLPPGGYQGTVALTSNGGAATIAVTMAVLPPQPPLPAVLLRVFLRDVSTGQVAATAEVNASTTGTFTLPVVPAGRYWLSAGTDLDEDGNFSEEGEYVGAWPSLDQPRPIEVEARGALHGYDLTIVARQGLGPAAAR